MPRRQQAVGWQTRRHRRRSDQSSQPGRLRQLAHLYGSLRRTCDERPPIPVAWPGRVRSRGRQGDPGAPDLRPRCDPCVIDGSGVDQPSPAGADRSRGEECPQDSRRRYRKSQRGSMWYEREQSLDPQVVGSSPTRRTLVPRVTCGTQVVHRPAEMRRGCIPRNSSFPRLWSAFEAAGGKVTADDQARPVPRRHRSDTAAT